MTTAPEWPPYLRGNRDHYHALGVIAATFNHLEYRLLGLTLLYTEFGPVPTFVFNRLKDNSARLHILREAVREKGESDAIKEAVSWFCKGMSACAENRNILMHSLTTSVTSEGEISHTVFNKTVKDDPTSWNRYYLDLPVLQRVADEMHAFERFGNGIFKHVVRYYRQDLNDAWHAWQIGSHQPFPETPLAPKVLDPGTLPAPEAA